MPNQIFVPQLVEAGIQAKLGDAIKLYPIAHITDIGNKLGGESVVVPKTAYVGDATVVAKGEAIPVADFTHSSVSVPVVKYGRALSYAQEDLYNAYFDIHADAEAQLLASVASGMEKDMFAKLSAIGTAMTFAEATKTALDSAIISQALVKFGEDLDGEKYLLVNPAEAGNLRADKGFVSTTDGKVKAIGEFYDCKVVVSNRVPAKQAFIVKPEAIGIYLNQNIMVEDDKNIGNQTHLVVGTAHAGVALRDESKAIKITLK